MRVLSLLISAIALAQAALAEDSCLAIKEFHASGGNLVKIKNTDPMQILPPVILLDCGNQQCVATIVVEGIVDNDGSLRDLKVIENTYADQREERAAALLQWMTKSRYEPPVLNGKSVCVHQTWRRKFGTLDPS